MGIPLPSVTKDMEEKTLKYIKGNCLRPVIIVANAGTTDTRAVQSGSYWSMSTTWSSPNACSIYSIQGGIGPYLGNPPFTVTQQALFGVQVSFSNTFSYAPSGNVNEGTVIYNQFCNQLLPSNIFADFRKKGIYLPQNTNIYFHIFWSDLIRLLAVSSNIQLGIVVHTITTTLRG